nr:thiosulfate oxidation carrier protein SoxY [Bosea sp. (in: a-proteobacteria)]
MSSPISSACARPEARPSRREVMAAGAAGFALAISPAAAYAAAPPTLAELIGRITEGAVPARGGIVFDIPQLVENGNSVDVAIQVESPMTESDHVRWIHVIAEKNPYPDMAASISVLAAAGPTSAPPCVSPPRKRSWRSPR